MRERCTWAGTDPIYVDYHDREWGVPLHEDRLLFEFLLLEGAQAGLSWITILKKRQAYRAAFDHFDPEKIAHYDDSRQAALLADAGIVRNRLKIRAFIDNARAYLKLLDEGIRFSDFLWQFVEGEPVQNRWNDISRIPTSTPIAERMSKSLKQKGFRFVGPTICYAFMQATGMVNDHTLNCFRHSECAALAGRR